MANAMELLGLARWKGGGCGAAFNCAPRGARPGARSAEAREGSKRIPGGPGPEEMNEEPGRRRCWTLADTPMGRLNRINWWEAHPFPTSYHPGPVLVCSVAESGELEGDRSASDPLQGAVRHAAGRADWRLNGFPSL